MNNPSLRSMPREQQADVFPPNMEGSILGWIEETGRFMDREVVIDPKLLEEDELTVSLIGGDDYADEDDDFSNNDDED
jgi:Protein of unknown function (DUF3134)